MEVAAYLSTFLAARVLLCVAIGIHVEATMGARER